MEFDYFTGELLSGRQKQKEDTHARILEMALALIRLGGEEAVTIRAVAAAAGITERTVFRHFRSRDVLLRSAWQRLRVMVGARLPRTGDALVDTPRHYFARLDKLRSLVRAYLYRLERREGRMRQDEVRQQVLLGCVEEKLEYLDEPNLRRRAAIADLIMSPYAWEHLQEVWGFSGKEAGNAAAEALEILLNRRLASEPGRY